MYICIYNSHKFKTSKRYIIRNTIDQMSWGAASRNPSVTPRQMPHNFWAI